jgi:hypothetical protein
MKRATRSYIILAVVLVIFVIVVVNQFVLFSDDPVESTTTGELIAPTLAKSSRGGRDPSSRQMDNEQAQVELDPGLRPLSLQALQIKSAFREQPSRNVFRYDVPPPEPPEPVPPPPLIIDSVDPSLVYAGTKAFTLRVSGRGFPDVAQIFVNGRPLATTHASASVLSVTVEKPLIAAPGQLQVEVKNAAGELYSNTLMVNVQPPPTPPFKYIGRIDNVVFLETGANNRVKARIGETVENQWRVTKVAGENVVLEDMALGIRHTIALPKREPHVASTPYTRTPQRSYQRRATPVPQRVFQPQPAPNQKPKPNAGSRPK